MGSSRKTSSGLLTKASASARRCRCPPDSVSNGDVCFVDEREPLEERRRIRLLPVERTKEGQRLARRDLVLQRRRLQRGADFLFHLVRLAAGIDAAHVNRAAVWNPQPDDALDRRRLAGAVWPDEAEDLPFADLETDVTRRFDAAVALFEIPDRDLGGHWRGSAARGCWRLAPVASFREPAANSDEPSPILLDHPWPAPAASRQPPAASRQRPAAR